MATYIIKNKSNCHMYADIIFTDRMTDKLTN